MANLRLGVVTGSLPGLGAEQAAARGGTQQSTVVVKNIK